MIELCTYGLMLTSQMTAELILKEARTEKQIQIAQAVLCDRHPGFVTDIKALFTEITQVRRDRNEVIHHVWGKADDEGAVEAASIRVFKGDKRRRFTAKQVWDVSDRLLCAVHDFDIVTRWSNNHPDVIAITKMQQPATPWQPLHLPSSVWPITPDLPWRAPEQPQPA